MHRVVDLDHGPGRRVHELDRQQQVLARGRAAPRRRRRAGRRSRRAAASTAVTGRTSDGSRRAFATRSSPRWPCSHSQSNDPLPSAIPSSAAAWAKRRVNVAGHHLDRSHRGRPVAAATMRHAGAGHRRGAGGRRLAAARPTEAAAALRRHDAARPCARDRPRLRVRPARSACSAAARTRSGRRRPGRRRGGGERPTSARLLVVDRGRAASGRPGTERARPAARRPARRDACNGGDAPRRARRRATRGVRLRGRTRPSARIRAQLCSRTSRHCTATRASGSCSTGGQPTSSTFRSADGSRRTSTPGRTTRADRETSRRA